MATSSSMHPTVEAAIHALQIGDKSAWQLLFSPQARLFDDGSPRDLARFTNEALGRERFTRIESIANAGLSVVGRFHSDQWGGLRVHFTFHLSPDGKIIRLDIGQTKRSIAT